MLFWWTNYVPRWCIEMANIQSVDSSKLRNWVRTLLTVKSRISKTDSSTLCCCNEINFSLAIHQSLTVQQKALRLLNAHASTHTHTRTHAHMHTHAYSNTSNHMHGHLPCKSLCAPMSFCPQLQNMAFNVQQHAPYIYALNCDLVTSFGETSISHGFEWLQLHVVLCAAQKHLFKLH